MYSQEITRRHRTAFVIAIDQSQSMLEELQGKLAAGGIKLCVTDATAIHNAVRPILSNKEIFDCDLYEAGLGERVEAMFAELNEGSGAVRATLKKYLTA